MREISTTAGLEQLGEKAESLPSVEQLRAMPRPHRESYRSRVLALADRLLNDAKQRRQWHADQWTEDALTWW